ncbi:MAG: ribbon-helix-helix domain-containing protein, partial [Candidatus Caldarchaeum sp.]
CRWRGLKAVKRVESSTGHQGVVGESSAKAGRSYCTVKIPESLAKALDEYLKEEDAELRGFRSRADVVVSLLVRYLEEQGLIKPKLKPRLEHVNVYEEFVLVRDNLLDATVEVCVDRSRVYCRYCLVESCVHVGYALSLDVVRERLEREGLKLPKKYAEGFGMVVFLNDVPYPVPSE